MGIKTNIQNLSILIFNLLTELAMDHGKHLTWNSFSAFLDKDAYKTISFHRTIGDFPNENLKEYDDTNDDKVKLLKCYSQINCLLN